MISRLLIAAAVLLASAARAELTVVSTAHREADSFKRISEYLTGKENPGRYAIARTEPERRDGFYISLIADEGNLPKNVSTIRVRFVASASLDIQTRDIPISDLDKRRLLVGLTGDQWSAPGARPLAWKIELLDPAGAVLQTAQSFLWAPPNIENAQ